MSKGGRAEKCIVIVWMTQSYITATEVTVRCTSGCGEQPQGHTPHTGSIIHQDIIQKGDTGCLICVPPMLTDASVNCHIHFHTWDCNSILWAPCIITCDIIAFPSMAKPRIDNPGANSFLFCDTCYNLLLRETLSFLCEMIETYTHKHLCTPLCWLVIFIVTFGI